MSRPAKPTTTFIIEVKGEAAAQRFRNFLDALEKMSNWGSSRQLFMEWDGDGADKLEVLDSSCVIDEQEVEIVPNFTKEQFDAALNSGKVGVFSSGVRGMVREKL